MLVSEERKRKTFDLSEVSERKRERDRCGGERKREEREEERSRQNDGKPPHSQSRKEN